MSSTRKAAYGIPFRQERFASSEVYRSSLNALLVAKRCAMLDSDIELRDFLWLVQEQCLSDPFNVGNRVGSIDQVAADLLAVAGYRPAVENVLVEVFSSSSTDDAFAYENVLDDPDRTRTELVRELAELSLNPKASAKALPGLGEDWRKIFQAYRTKIKRAAQQSVAATSVLKSVVDALKFTKETGMPSLTLGGARAC